MLKWAVDNGFDDYLRIASERWGETNYRTLVAGARAATETVAQAADAANDALKGLPDHISDKDLRIYKSPVTSRDAEGKDLSKADMIHRLNQLRVAINAQIAPVDVSLTRDQQTVIAVMEKIRMIEEALAPAGARAAARESVAELMRRVYDREVLARARVREQRLQIGVFESPNKNGRGVALHVVADWETMNSVLMTFSQWVEFRRKDQDKPYTAAELRNKFLNTVVGPKKVRENEVESVADYMGAYGHDLRLANRTDAAGNIIQKGIAQTLVDVRSEE